MFEIGSWTFAREIDKSFPIKSNSIRLCNLSKLHTPQPNIIRDDRKNAFLLADAMLEYAFLFPWLLNYFQYTRHYNSCFEHFQAANFQANLKSFIISISFTFYPQQTL